DEHWQESVAAIQGCLESYPDHPKVGLTSKERAGYAALRDDRPRATFRICRSLSLSKKNESRVFFLSAEQLGERLGCACQCAARQFEYLMKAGALELVELGERWSQGTKARSTRYRWLLR